METINRYEKFLVLFFLLNLLLSIYNFIFHSFPYEISTYFFWLSLGLCLGFQFCKMEMKKAWKKITEKENKGMPSKHSPN